MSAQVADTTMIALFLPLAGALLAPLAYKRLGWRTSWLLALLPLSSFLHYLTLLPQVMANGKVTGGMVWVSAYNLSFSWFYDGLSLTFALLITGIGTLIVLYAGAYMRGKKGEGAFMGFLLLFMAAMLGLVSSDSFLMLFMYWEATSIASFLLIGFDHERSRARRAALQALIITGGGGLCLLAGLLLMWTMSGANTFSLLLMNGEGLQQSPWYLALLFLILAGAFTKSAQFPFHVWLPNAMEAPTPVSAYLHSATMVKAGIYLLLRLSPILGGTVAWQILLPFFGGITLILGAWNAVGQRDLKQMLAQTTIASLGLMVMMIGFGTEHALSAAVLYLLAHALFKGALFMVAGSVDHGTGSRDISLLSGLGRIMPFTFLAAILAGFSMAGLPPYSGFMAKEEIYEALAGTNARNLLFTAIAIFGNGLMLVIGFVIGFKIFIGKRSELAEKAHESPFLLWAPPLVLALGGLCAGLFSQSFHHMFSSPMVSAAAGQIKTITVSAIPHISISFMLSALTIVFGIVALAAFDQLQKWVRHSMEALGPGFDHGFDVALAGLIRFAHRLTTFVHGGRLDVYTTVTMGLIALGFLLPLWLYQEGPSLPALPQNVTIPEIAFIFIALAGLLAVLKADNRLNAIVALGIQGFAVSVLFLLYGAPDLSFTQFMIETLSVVILALAMTRLKLHPADRRPLRYAALDGFIAILCGLGFFLMLLKVVEGPFDDRLSVFFSTYSKVIAHGANVVNVIIVDFRGVDTLGEIAVVMVTGLAILALIRIRSPRRILSEKPESEKTVSEKAGAEKAVSEKAGAVEAKS